jgi:hypothetical protein
MDEACKTNLCCPISQHKRPLSNTSAGTDFILCMQKNRLAKFRRVYTDKWRGRVRQRHYQEDGWKRFLPQ